MINHHVHSTGSDGKDSPRKMVEAALKKNLSFICFTDHNFRPYANPWGENFFSKEYIQEVLDLKEEFPGRLEISFGIEIDWVEGQLEFFKEQIKSFPLDFVLGSVHMIKFEGEDYIGLNFDKKLLLHQIEKKGVKAIVKEYFRQIRLMVNSGLFDCVAHLDLVKAFNENNLFLREDEPFYKEEVALTLDEIKRNNLCIEINTQGVIYDCNSMFPSFWILQEANKRGIPITIGADSHWVDRIDSGISEAYELARKAGYKDILKFKQRKATKVLI